MSLQSILCDQYVCFFPAAPAVSWQVNELTISEGDIVQVCFIIGETAQIYEVEIGVRGNDNNTAGNL